MQCVSYKSISLCTYINSGTRLTGIRVVKTCSVKVWILFDEISRRTPSFTKIRKRKGIHNIMSQTCVICSHQPVKIRLKYRSFSDNNCPLRSKISGAENWKQVKLGVEHLVRVPFLMTFGKKKHEQLYNKFRYYYK